MKGVRRSDLIIALLIVSVVVFSAFSKHTETGGPDTYSSTDYNSGGYAAWYELLRREGVNVGRFEQRLTELDASIDTLIVAGPVQTVPGAVTAQDVPALEAWVRAGGRAVVLGRSVAFGFPRAAKSGRERYGKGVVDFVRDPRVFDNGAIARANNARLAYELGRPRAPGGAVAFDEELHGAIVERSWWNVIGVPGRVTLAGITLAVLLALAGGALRLGPPVASRAAREPASSEFVAAVASLYERAHARRAAIGLLAARARGGGASAERLQQLAAESTPSERDPIASAALARTIRMER